MALHDSWHHPSHEPDAHSELEVQGSPTPAKPQKLALMQAPSVCPVTGTQQLLTQSSLIAHFAWQRPVCSMQKAPAETPSPRLAALVVERAGAARRLTASPCPRGAAGVAQLIGVRVTRPCQAADGDERQKQHAPPPWRHRRTTFDHQTESRAPSPIESRTTGARDKRPWSLEITQSEMTWAAKNRSRERSREKE